MDEELHELHMAVQELSRKIAVLERSDTFRVETCQRHYTDLTEIKQMLQKYIDRLALKAGKGELSVLRNELMDSFRESNETVLGEIKNLCGIVTQLIAHPSSPNDTKSSAVRVAKIQSQTSVRTAIITGILTLAGSAGIWALVQVLIFKAP